MPNPAGMQQVKRRSDAGRTNEFPGVRYEEQSGPVSDPEGPLEVRRRPAPLVIGEPEPGNPLPRILSRQPSQRPRVHRVPGPVGGNDDPDPDIRRPRRLSGSVEHELGKGRDPPVHRREPRRIGLQLKPPGPLGPLILGNLSHEPVQVVLSAKHRARRVIKPLKPKPPALISGRQLRRPLLGESSRQRHAMNPRELNQGRVTHAPSQMQMQMSLGQPRQSMRHSLLSPTNVLARRQEAVSWRFAPRGAGVLAREESSGDHLRPPRPAAIDQGLTEPQRGTSRCGSRPLPCPRRP